MAYIAIQFICVFNYFRQQWNETLDTVTVNKQCIIHYLPSIKGNGKLDDLISRYIHNSDVAFVCLFAYWKGASAVNKRSKATLATTDNRSKGWNTIVSGSSKWRQRCVISCQMSKSSGHQLPPRLQALTLISEGWGFSIGPGSTPGFDAVRCLGLTTKAFVCG